MNKYKIGIAQEIKVVEIEADSLIEAKSIAWNTLSREEQDCHIETYEVEDE